MLTPKERLLAALNKQPVDRPPVICPGGMMNAAIVEIMAGTGPQLPAAHLDAELMAGLAAAIQKKTGFENIGLPFCMTVEAEALGSEVTYGSLACEPKVVKELYPSTASVVRKDTAQLQASGRMATVAAAARLLSRRYPDIPVVGSITGPISTAASLVDPLTMLKDLRKNEAEAHRVLQYVSEVLIDFAGLLIDSGVSVITIGDPTATGEILGPAMFARYAVTYLNKVADAVQDRGIPVIVHICGQLQSVRGLIPTIRADAISTDAMVDLRGLKAEFPQLTTMGNVSTYLLETGPAERIVQTTRRLVKDGVDIISPACGLSTASSLLCIRAMTDAVRSG